MVYRWGMVIFGSISALCLLVATPAWALPTHEYDMGWGKGGFHDKPDHEKHDYKYGLVDSHWGGVGKDWWGKSTKYHAYGGHDSKKCGKKYGKDPDCDPPVAIPEPGTLLLLGSTLAGLGMYARRRRQSVGGSPPDRG